MNKIFFFVISILITFPAFAYTKGCDWGRLSYKKALTRMKDIDKEDKSCRTPLMQAAMENEDPRVISLLIDNGEDVDAKDYSKMPVIQFAIQQNPNIEVVKTILNENPNLNTKDIYGNPLLFIALQREDFNVYLLSEFIKRNVNLNELDRFGKSLPNAILESKNKYELLKLLKNTNIDINNKGGEKYTAVMNAAKNNDIETLKILISLNANINFVNEDKETALTLAKDERIINFLLDNGADVNIVNNKENNFLDEYVGSSFIKTKNSEILNKILKGTKDINKFLFNAASIGDFDAILWLLENNRKFDFSLQHYKTNETLFYVLISNDHFDIIKKLIEQGFDINFKDRVGNNALIYAARFGNNEYIKYFINKGIKVNDQNNYWRTPLIETLLGPANLKNIEQNINTLLDNGAAVSVIDYYGKIIFDYIDDHKGLKKEFKEGPTYARLKEIFKYEVEHGMLNEINAQQLQILYPRRKMYLKRKNKE
ncbi:MAG: ankyrin repeat domain-containing protein [Alphaproteobacteria bacterium]|nr:ankyrin repeat domain-containing protein [Alphaproteobacteria bacterium]